jgi:hypothetical protein
MKACAVELVLIGYVNLSAVADNIHLRVGKLSEQRGISWHNLKLTERSIRNHLDRVSVQAHRIELVLTRYPEPGTSPDM